MNAKDIVIVGGSAAGWFTAEALRRHGYDGKLTIVGDEPPYDRPPLSKQYLAGDWGAERLALMPESRMKPIEATVLEGRRAEGLDLHGRTLSLDDGETLAWDQLVVATGVRPRRLPVCDVAGALLLRSTRDSEKLAAAIRRQRRLVILGGGFIGLEVAATARKMGAEVVVIEPQQDPMAARVGAAVSAKLLQRHRDEGVELRLGQRMHRVETRETSRGGTAVAAVELEGGEMVEAETLLVSIGCTPNSEWLEGSGLTLDDGVVCDAFCSAGGGVWAAGDVARWHHRGLGRSIRIEHRTNASEMGDAVARNILGQQRPYCPVPFFWTDQYDVKLQLAGVIAPGVVPKVEHGELEGDSFVQAWRSDGRLTGAIGWRAAKALTAFRRELVYDPDAETA